LLREKSLIVFTVKLVDIIDARLAGFQPEDFHPVSKNCYKGPQNEPKVKLSHALRGGEDKYHHTHDNQEQK